MSNKPILAALALVIALVIPGPLPPVKTPAQQAGKTQFTWTPGATYMYMTVDFPQAFSAPPIVVANIEPRIYSAGDSRHSDGTALIWFVEASRFGVYIKRPVGSGDGGVFGYVHWLATMPTNAEQETRDGIQR